MRFNAVTRRRESGFRAPAVVASGLLSLVAATRAVAQGAQRIHDSTSADSIRFDQAPLPGGPAAVSRFLLSEVPQWIQIGGIVVGAIVAITVLTIAWKRRAEIIGWLTSRSRGTKMAMGGAVVLGLGMAGGAGMWSWNFMMHDNDFCSSCHVMKSAFGRFTKSEHDKLKCHDCHQQSIFASTKELYYWVLDRPEEIPKHAPVPNRICGECHEQKAADSTWKRVIATAGHAIHFKSDSSKLKGLMCVDCHARQVHAFKAPDVSCGQEGCHDKIKVRLGKMADQTGLHCVTCHEFTAPVNESSPVDSTRKSLVPAKPECFSCHEMREKLEKRGLDKDPHKGTCGTCHNPHDQTKAGKAFETCANAGCHANADTLTAFHRGLGKHGLDDCGSCHIPHSWKVESKSCITCHSNIYKDDPKSRARLRPAEAAAGSASASASAPASFAHASEPGVRRGGPSPEGVDDGMADLAPPVIRPVATPTTPTDTTFLHSRHKSVKCESCHRTDRVHGQVTIKAPADCAACHHASDARAGKCATCHPTSELGKPYLVQTTMKVTGRASPITRALQYLHPQHQKLECAQCHAAGEPKRRVKTCAECHTDHHRSTATCSSCHEDSKAAHTREAHLGCSSCHTPSFVATLPPSRTLCLSCHKAQQDHKPGQDCEGCHRTGWVKAEGTP